MKTFPLIWITGLAGAGKSTTAAALCEKLRKSYSNVVHIDGDTVREVCGGDLGYDPSARLQNAFRICRLCKVLHDQGLLVVCSTMSMYPEIWEWNRKQFHPYIQVFLDVSRSTLRLRDQKLLYTKVSQGIESNVVSEDLQFQRPEKSTLELSNDSPGDIENNVKQIADLVATSYEQVTK